MDYDILRRLQNPGNTELVLTPRTIAENTNWSRSGVDNHLRILRDHGLIEYYDEDKSLYQISERGRKWLEGDLPTEKLEGNG
ncbi:helix-turn-helix domain-containing protein [Halobacterium hubeiense]|uniref:helix-turn-helix domain-containing protein n=1 Tax=Halobacterium hubeiense TaxID=1407499 RepID=UPI003C785DB8